MNTRLKIASAALAVSLGLAASPVLAQTYGGSAYGASDSASYNADGTLNVWGAHIEPRGRSNGLLGGVFGGGNAYEPSATGSIGEYGVPGPRGYTAY